MTTAARARALHRRSPALSADDIAARLGMSRQDVERALASSGKRGRPGIESRAVRLSAKVLDAVDAEAVERGMHLRDAIEGACALWLVLCDRTRARRKRVRDGVTPCVNGQSNQRRKRRRLADGKAE